MTKLHWVPAIAIFSAVTTFGQAYSVQPSGGMTQERPTSVLAIPPEDQATKEQLAKLFDAMRIREQVQATRTFVSSNIEQQLHQQVQEITEGGANSKLTPEQRAEAAKLVAKYVEKSVDIYPVDEMLGDMATIYQRYLTREDVDAMNAFYASGPGQHLLDAQPKIRQDFMPIVMQRAQQRSQVLMAELMKELNDLRQSSKPAPASPPKQPK